MKKKVEKVRVILMDVDGTLTSGQIVYNSDGLEIKHFNAHDGLGIKLARISGLKTGIISARESGTIRTRAQELKMDYLYLGREEKLPALEEFLRDQDMNPDEVCFIGDDLPDISVMRRVGFAVAVKNASGLTKKEAHYVTRRPGGDGAIREVIEFILKSQGKFEKAMKMVVK